jgi:uncharacterized protein (DUF58 family)
LPSPEASSATHALLNTLRRRLFRPHAAQDAGIVLVQRRIFILPTRAGVAFALVLLLILAGSINYSLGLGVLLTFLLASFGVTAMLHTFRNLARLRVTPVRAKPVFAGQLAHFSVCLTNPAQSDRHAIQLSCGRGTPDIVDVPAAGSTIASTTMPATTRGLLRPERLTLYTRFPVGLYYAWAYVSFDTHCVVYPKPAVASPLPWRIATRGDAAGSSVGPDDFAGLRQYQPGDSPRHIAWKAVARQHGLLTKQFSGGSAAELWLSFESLPASLDLEGKLSTLTRWVLDAHAGGLAFGLKLPDTVIAIGSGERHRDRCLEALALHPADQPRAAAP